MMSSVFLAGTNTIVQFLTALLVFVFVIILTRLTIKWAGSFQKIQSGNRNFEVIETFKVTSNKFLQIVKIGSRYFLIGIGKDSVEYFTELDESDLDLSPKPTTQDSFQMLLDKAKEHIHKRSDGNE